MRGLPLPRHHSPPRGTTTEPLSSLRQCPVSPLQSVWFETWEIWPIPHRGPTASEFSLVAVELLTVADDQVVEVVDFGLPELGPAFGLAPKKS